MKKSQKPTSAVTMSNSTITKTALFESLISNEIHQAKEAEIHKYTTRVGLVLKVLSNRDLTALQLSFQDDLTRLVEKYCALIAHAMADMSTFKKPTRSSYGNPMMDTQKDGKKVWIE